MKFYGWESVLFYVISGWAVLMGLMVVSVHNPVHSALALVSALVSIAGLFVLLHAEFLAGVQILVYVGGVMVLFLFVIMLVSVEREEKERHPIFTSQAFPAILLSAVLAFVLTIAASLAGPVFAPSATRERASAARTATAAGGVSENTENVGVDLYARAALPFEVASVLLLVAIVGSVLLAREKKQETMYD